MDPHTAESILDYFGARVSPYGPDGPSGPKGKSELKKLRIRCTKYVPRNGTTVINFMNPVICPYCCQRIIAGTCMLDNKSEELTNAIDIYKCQKDGWVNIVYTTGGVDPYDYLGRIGSLIQIHGMEYYLFAWLKIIATKKIQRWWKHVIKKRQISKALNNFYAPNVSYASVVQKMI